MQPGPDSTEWQFVNRQRLVAIELQREMIQGLERRARQRELDDTTRRLELQRGRGRGRALEHQARQYKPDDTPRRLELQSQREKYTVRDLDEQIRDREQQRKHDKASIKRTEQRRVNEQLESARKEETSLDSHATIERDWELWRLEDKARRLGQHWQKSLRDRAGIRAEGVYKRPAVAS